MNLADRYELIAKAIRKEVTMDVWDMKKGWVTLEFYEHANNESIFVSPDGMIWQYPAHYAQECKLIRATPKLPKLTYEEKEFLKWFPQDWWIARNAHTAFVNLHNEKPKKMQTCWKSDGVLRQLDTTTFPLFLGIKWSDEDCYTIDELRK